jgi:SAM-dependent methyltransferase
MSNTENYIDNWFIHISYKKIPISFYVVRKSILKAIDELKPKIHGQVLDIACGVMPYKNRLLNENVTQYLGIDLETSQYHNTRKPDLFWDGKNIPLKNDSCDFVIATEFFEHYFDSENILKEIHRVLKKDGVLFFTTPNIWPLHEVPYDYNRASPFFFDELLSKISFSKWEIKPLGGAHYFLAQSIAVWNDFTLSNKRKKMIRPFIISIIKFLLKKDKTVELTNGSLYSGIYGYVTK